MFQISVIGESEGGGFSHIGFSDERGRDFHLHRFSCEIEGGTAEF